MRDLLQKGIAETELEQAKKTEINTIGEMQQNLGFQYSRTELLGEGLLYENDPGFYYKRLEKQLKLKEKDVHKVAKKWLGSEPFRILFWLPEEG